MAKSIVTIGGGTGSFVVISGLMKQRIKNISAIVSMADDGGATGILREEFGILPPGSVRPALIALSDSEKLLANLFSYRFDKGDLNGHNFGNLLIAALTEITGSFEKAIEEAGKILNIKGKVIPSTLDNARLVALLENNKVIEGETNIDIPKHNGNLKIEKVYLKPPCKANPKALKAIFGADLVVIGPGDLYSSIIPNLLVRGISQAIQKSRAKKVYICNLMTKFGETNNFTALDFVKIIEKYLGENVLDFVILNNKKPTLKRILKYEKERANFVKYKIEDFKNKKFKIIEGNFLRPKGFIRHNPDKLAKTILSVLNLF